jgi:hypothetical protein
MVSKKFFGEIVLLVSIVAGTAYFYTHQAVEEITPEPEVQPSAQSAQPLQERRYGEVEEFTAEEFKQAYDALALPNIVPIVQAPPITGDEAADKRIRDLAESRGYRLRDVASGLLNEIDEKPVQELLIADWGSLQDAALSEGVKIEFRSGYRSIEDQKDIFLSYNFNFDFDAPKSIREHVFSRSSRRICMPGCFQKRSTCPRKMVWKSTYH